MMNNKKISRQSSLVGLYNLPYLPTFVFYKNNYSIIFTEQKEVHYE